MKRAAAEPVAADEAPAPSAPPEPVIHASPLPPAPMPVAPLGPPTRLPQAAPKQAQGDEKEARMVEPRAKNDAAPAAAAKPPHVIFLVIAFPFWIVYEAVRGLVNGVIGLPHFIVYRLPGYLHALMKFFITYVFPPVKAIALPVAHLARDALTAVGRVALRLAQRIGDVLLRIIMNEGRIGKFVRFMAALCWKSLRTGARWLLAVATPVWNKTVQLHYWTWNKIILLAQWVRGHIGAGVQWILEVLDRLTKFCWSGLCAVGRQSIVLWEKILVPVGRYSPRVARVVAKQVADIAIAISGRVAQFAREIWQSLCQPCFQFMWRHRYSALQQTWRCLSYTAELLRPVFLALWQGTKRAWALVKFCAHESWISAIVIAQFCRPYILGFWRLLRGLVVFVTRAVWERLRVYVPAAASFVKRGVVSFSLRFWHLARALALNIAQGGRWIALQYSSRVHPLLMRTYVAVWDAGCVLARRVREHGGAFSARVNAAWAAYWPVVQQMMARLGDQMRRLAALFRELSKALEPKFRALSAHFAVAFAQISARLRALGGGGAPAAGGRGLKAE